MSCKLRVQIYQLQGRNHELQMRNQKLRVQIQELGVQTNKLENKSTSWWKFNVPAQILKHKLKIKSMSWNWKAQAI